jgi:hypothetical protein
LVFLVIFVVRAMSGKTTGTPVVISPWTRIVVLKFFIAMLVLGAAANSPLPVSLALWTLFAAFCLPTLLVGPLVVWLGMPRLAYWSLRCCLPLHYAGNAHAGAMLYAALSATRMREPATACAWLNERFRAKPLTGVIGQTVLGHLAAAQGDQVTARCLFESIDARPRRPRQWIVRVTARDWLVMDAARRGDWPAVVRHATRAGTTRWSRAVGGMARAFAGLAPLPNWQLWPLWLIAPRRAQLYPLLQRALAAGVQRKNPDIACPPDLPAALAVLADVLTRKVSSADFMAAVRWVALRLESTEVKVHVGQRLAALDQTLSHGGDAVLSLCNSDVVELIVPVLAANPQLVAEDRDQPIIAEALRRIQGTAFESIEMRTRDLARRAEQKHALDTLSEWQPWAILCNEANQLLALQPEAKATLFEVMWRPLVKYAVFQHNDMTRHAYAQDIFRWLRAHAHVGHQAVAMLDKNIACYQPKD